MGGGKGLLNGAQIVPYNNQGSSQCIKNEKKSVHLTPKGFRNVGNTCYANAALQCLLSTALSHALLDPETTVLFKRYASNPDLLAMGSGSVDSDEEEMLCPRKTPSNHKVSNNTLNDSDTSEVKISMSEQRRCKRRKQKHTEQQKQMMRDTCSWLTKELTSITESYTAKPDEPEVADVNMYNQLGNLFNSMFLSPSEDKCVLDPGSITLNVNRLSPCLKPYQQEDAHEFVRALLSTLTMEGQNRKLSTLFDGLLESSVTCQTCRHASITRDRYMDLSLDIQHEEVVDLHGALKKFTQTELLDEDNKVECSKCKTKRVVTKGLRLATAPSILLFHLKRFKFDNYGRVTRLSKHVQYPLRIEIGGYMSRANQAKPPPYELVGVLVHAGKNCNSGHYYAFVKSGETWYKTSDGDVTKVEVEVVLKQSAYILIYEVEGMRREHGLHSYDKYHKKKICKDEDLIRSVQNKSTRRSTDKLSQSEHGSKTRGINEWVRQSQEEIVRENSLSKTVKEPSSRGEKIISKESSTHSKSLDIRKKTEIPFSLLDRVLSLCGNSSYPEEESCCGSLRKSNRKEKHPTLADLKQGNPVKGSSSESVYVKTDVPLAHKKNRESNRKTRGHRRGHSDYSINTANVYINQSFSSINLTDDYIKKHSPQSPIKNLSQRKSRTSNLSNIERAKIRTKNYRYDSAPRSRSDSAPSRHRSLSRKRRSLSRGRKSDKILPPLPKRKSSQ